MPCTRKPLCYRVVGSEECTVQVTSCGGTIAGVGESTGMRVLSHSLMEWGCEGSPLWFPSSWCSTAAHILVLVHDMFNLDISKPSDGIGHHELPQQCLMVRYYNGPH